MSALAVLGVGGPSPIPALAEKAVAPSPRTMDLNVLIVDDDERLYELLAQYLAENGVIAKRAATGPQGLKASGLSRSVRPRNDLQQVTVGIFEVHAAAAVVVVDLASTGLAGVSPVVETARTDAAEDLIELGFADQKGVML